MWKMLPLVVLCALTQPTMMLDMQTDEEVRFERYERVQIIQVRGDRTIVYSRNGYYQIKSDLLLCR